MAPRSPGGAARDGRLAQTLARQLVQTGLGLSTVAEVLFDALPPDAFPDEDTAEVLLQMLAGTIAPVVARTAPDTVDAAIVFLRAVHETVEDEVRTMGVRARERLGRA
jgi:hypothetical protein